MVIKFVFLTKRKPVIRCNTNAFLMPVIGFTNLDHQRSEVADTVEEIRIRTKVEKSLEKKIERGSEQPEPALNS